jgi:dipeptide transport system ATP-binding protein
MTTTPIVMQAQSLVRHYSVSLGFLRGTATVKALDGVSFALARGRTLAVVGESGCGKSTLARQLTMLEPATSGQLLIDGSDASQAGMHKRVQMVFQNPYASLNPRKSIGAALQEPLIINTALSRSERSEQVEAMLARVGLRPEHARRYPHMFSGGQRQRVAIARAMMLNPSVVVADEPVSALDVSIQAQILNLFMDLQDSDGTSYVFISHNLGVVEHIAHDVMVMYLGKVVEQGSKAELFARPLHPYTRVLMSATPTIDPAQRKDRMRITGELPSPLNAPPGCSFSPRCPFAVGRCRTDAPALRDIGGRQVACHLV